MEKYPEVASRYYGKAAPTGKDGIVALNTILAQDGFVVYVPEGVVVERPIQLVNIFRSDVDTMANRRILVIMEARSEAKLLVCDHSIDDVKFLVDTGCRNFCGRRRLLRLLRPRREQRVNYSFCLRTCEAGSGK